MPTNFPTSLDVLTNPTETDDLDDPGVFHDVQHADANDAIEALEAKVGITDSADASSLDFKIRNIQKSWLPSSVAHKDDVNTFEADQHFNDVVYVDSGDLRLATATAEAQAGIWMNGRDILGVRNIQSGPSFTGSWNLDIGAGTTEEPGDVVLNYDVGEGTQIWTGRAVATGPPVGMTQHELLVTVNSGNDGRIILRGKRASQKFTVVKGPASSAATDEVDVFNINTQVAIPFVEIVNGAWLRIFSDNYSTVKFTVDGSSGDTTIKGTFDHDGSNVGFYGVAPVSRATIAAAASDPATTQALVNDLRTKLIALGLVQA